MKKNLRKFDKRYSVSHIPFNFYYNSLQVVLVHPMLDDYVDMWPLDIIIAHLLKYLSSHQKDKDFREAVESLQARK